MTPVIVCDGCGRATPAELGRARDGTVVSADARLDELRGQGWLLTDERDLCPDCHHHARVAIDELGNP